MNQSVRILHLEDDAADAELVEAILASAGMVCRITRVQTGDAFGEALRQSEYDIILADFKLPAYDGLSALRLSQELARDVPFIFVSGAMGEDAAIEGLTEGATDYVLKDKLTRLEPAVKRALRDAENRQERRRAEAALRESEQMLKLVLDTIPVRVFWKDLDSDYLGCNRPFALDAGLQSPEEIMGRNDFETGWAEQAELYRSDDRLVMETGRPKLGYEEPQTTRDGKRIWPRTNKVPLLDTQGRIKGVLGTYEDITESKQLEAALQQSELRYRNLVESSQDWVWEVDQNGVFTYAGPHCRELLGYEPEELIGKKPFDLMSPDEAMRVEESFASIAAQRKPFRALVNASRHKDGRLVLLETNGVPVLDGEGKLRGYRGMDRDITQRKQAEEALRLSEELLSVTLTSISDPVFITDNDGRFTFICPNVPHILGYSMEEMQAMGNISKLVGDDLFSPEGLEMREEIANIERLIVDNHGSQRVFLTTVKRVSIGEGTRLYAMHDITERKQAEAERAKLEAQNLQLHKAESLGRIAGAIAHHFNNHLGVVIGKLELAMIDLPSGSEVQASLAEAMKASHRASEVSNLMLTYLGQTSGNDELLDLSEVCRRSMPMLQAVIPKDVVMVHNLPSPGPTVSANASRIQQALTNLITNAWEAVGDDQGAIHLTVKTASPAEIPAAHRFPIDWQPRDNAYACLEVMDTCDGISDKDIEKIFDPFFSTKFAGRSLGLSVVLGIVRAHGGVITVESEPGRGSVFRVFFPMSAEGVPRQPDKVTKAPEMEEGCTVLLVEDEEMLRNMAEAMLRCLGFTVLTAKDGVDAVEVFRQHEAEIRCVLCDLSMPRMNGWETVAALRALRPGIPVVLASGYDEAKVMDGKRAELPQAFLHKPYTMVELKAALGAEMGASSAVSMKGN